MKILFETGPQKDRLNLVFLADGFLSSEESAFDFKAKEIADYLISKEGLGFIAYKYNGYSCFTSSQQSGINHPKILGDYCGTQPAVKVTTHYGCSFDSIHYGTNRVHRLITPASTNFVKSEMIRLVTGHTGKGNYLALIICNVSAEGGGADGMVATCTLSEYSTQTAFHELGHSIGGLMEEYPTGAISEGWNCTKETNPDKVRWAHLIPPLGVVKINAQGFNVPSLICKMNKVTDPFCLWCQQKMSEGTDYYIKQAEGTIPLPPTNPAPPITAPTLALGNVLNNSVQVKWNKQKANSYAFYLRPINGQWKSAGTANGDAVMRTFQSLKRKTEYEFKVVLFSGGVQYESTIKATTK